jgi:hypothetical protein
VHNIKAGVNKWLQMKISTSSASIDLNFNNFQELKKQEAIDYTVDQLVKNYDNLYVCLSGGIDSEFAAECLLSRGVEFTPLIVDIENHRSESWYAHYWCYKNKITPKIIKLPWDFVKKTFPSITKKIPGSAFINALDYFCWLEAEKDNGKLVTGTTEPFDRVHGSYDMLSPGTTGFELNINSFDFNLNYLGDHPGGFLCYTPALFYNMIKDLDYNKPVQIAMSEYYGVAARPKTTFLDLTDPLVQINNYSFNFDIGNKDIFLKRGANQEIIRIEGTAIL